MKPTPVRVFGLMLAAMGLYLALFPQITADLLGKPADTATRMINLRASWGGTLLGLGAFVAWLPAPRPWGRAVVGLVMWAMAGIGVARLIGFVADGDPDMRQAIWITAEVAIVIACAVGLRVMARRRRATA
ncbi:MAG: DUF4345 family protein [Kofleriaceae bacterium]